MSKRPVKVNTFFPKRIFATDIWGIKTEEEVDNEYDENKIISKFAAETIPSTNNTFTRGQKYASNEKNEFGFVGNFSDEFPNGLANSPLSEHSSTFPVTIEDSHVHVTPSVVPQAPISPIPVIPNESVIAYRNNFEAQQRDKQVIQYEQTELEKETLLRAQQMQSLATPVIPVEQPVTYQEPQAPLSYHLPTPAPAPIAHEEVQVVYHEPEPIAYQEPIYAPQVHEEINLIETPLAYHEPVVQDEAPIYQEQIATPELFHEPAVSEAIHTPVAPESTITPPPPPPPVISEYERLVSQGTKNTETETEIKEKKSDFDYFALSGKEEVNQQNNLLQFENSEFIAKQIEEIHSNEAQESKSIHKLLMVYKKKILIGVAAVVFVMCIAILYTVFTSGGDTPNIKAPADITSNTTEEKPVVIVPSQNGGEQQSGHDANGNPIGN